MPLTRMFRLLERLGGSCGQVGIRWGPSWMPSWMPSWAKLVPSWGQVGPNWGQEMKLGQIGAAMRQSWGQVGG
eukprot:12412214-Karenia_brevis.AAC.1